MNRKMKKVTIVAPLVVFLFLSLSFPEENERMINDGEWNKTFGGRNIDIANYVTQTKDEEYIIAGYSMSFGAGNFDAWLIKVSADGNEEWNKTFGGMKEDVASCVVQTVDEGYIITGHTFSYGAGNGDAWLIKTDRNGNEIWNKTFGGKYFDWASSVVETNGYILIGTTLSYGAGEQDIWLIKTDRNGNEIWNKTFGGKDTEYGEYINQTKMGDYVIAGTTASYGPGKWDIWLIKIDENGNEIWNKTFGEWDMEQGNCVRQTNDGGYIITGTSTSFTPGDWDDIVLIKTDGNGEEEWIKLFGSGDQDFGASVVQLIDGGYLIAGFTFSIGAGDSDAWLIKTDKNGNEIWNKTFGIRKTDLARCVIQSEDGSYIVVGSTDSYGAGNSDAWLIKCYDYSPPTLKINKPKEGYLYICDREILQVKNTIIFGRITIDVGTHDFNEKINKVKFYLAGPNFYDFEPRAVATSPPYIWKWNGFAFGSYDLWAVAPYGNNGAHATDKINVKIFNI